MGPRGKQLVRLVVLVHSAGIGDRVCREDEWAGTKGEARQIEGFQVTSRQPVPGLALRGMAHVQNVGDTEWQSAGSEADASVPTGTGFVGTRAQALRVEGFAIACAGPASDQYEVQCRAHVQDLGDIGPFREGEFCGTRDQGKRIEAIKVQLWQQPVLEERKGPQSLSLQVPAHIQDEGDRISQADAWVGVPGSGRRVKGLQIALSEQVPDLALRYTAHIENVGDTGWACTDCRHSPGAPAGCAYVGTRGQGLRLEGFAIECVGRASTRYEVVCYAVVEGLGELGPFRDGEFCGSRGQQRRLEAVKVTVVRREGSQQRRPEPPPYRRPHPHTAGKDDGKAVAVSG